MIIFKISRYPMFASFIMHDFCKIGGEVCPEQARKEFGCLWILYFRWIIWRDFGLDLWNLDWISFAKV